MKILNKVSLKNLKLNKKRTISTVIGIILSTALICAACTLATSFQATLVQNAINETGYYHLSLENLTLNDIETIKNNRDVKEIFSVLQEGYGILSNGTNKDKPYLKLCSMNEDTFQKLNFELEEGRFAQNNGEIVISRHIETNGEVKYNIGDTITIEVGKRESLDGFELHPGNPYDVEAGEHIVNPQKRTFKVVGVIKRPNTSFENYSDVGYTVITTGDASSPNGKIEGYIALKDPKEYETSIPQMLGVSSMRIVQENSTPMKYDVSAINHELLRWEVFAFSDNTLAMLYSVIVVVVIIILFTSVFCIRNSFAISTTEKIKMYGMLSSIGATKKQIKKSVIFEALMLGLVGIPLGILSGILAVWVLLQIVNSLLGPGALLAYTDGILFKVSIIPIILSIVLGFLTVYLSAMSSAKKASKVSPIEQLRNAKDIKINSKKLKTPKIISKVFKVGGVLAYKNLKRSKKKYRTTVVSLAVSISIFIAMNAFLHNALGMAGRYYEDYDYNIVISTQYPHVISEEELSQIKAVGNIKESYVLYESMKNYIEISDLDKVVYQDEISEEIKMDPKTGNAILDSKGDVITTGRKYMGLEVVALDSESFASYAKKIGSSYEKVKGTGILCDTYAYYENSVGNTIEERVYNYKKGENIVGSYNKKEVSILVGEISKIKPYGYENYSYHGGYLVVEYGKHSEFNFEPKFVTIESDKPEQASKEIEKLNLSIHVRNMEEEVQGERSMVIVINIFLYGFITVISLIGVTNIFNTITSNMELRQKEFAMLKSIGMTKREFNRMINLETVFYGTKSLIYGIVLGLLATFALYKSFAVKIDSGMYVPVNAIMISVVLVFILVFVIMRYSLGKINKQNTIETIRNENV